MSSCLHWTCFTIIFQYKNLQRRRHDIQGMVSWTSYLLLTWLWVVSNSSEWSYVHVLSRLVEVWGACLKSLCCEVDERERHEHLRILNDHKKWFLHALRGLHALHFLMHLFGLLCETKWNEQISSPVEDFSTQRSKVTFSIETSDQFTFVLSFYTKNTFRVLVAL